MGGEIFRAADQRSAFICQGRWPGGGPFYLCRLRCLLDKIDQKFCLNPYLDDLC